MLVAERKRLLRKIAVLDSASLAALDEALNKIILGKAVEDSRSKQ